MMRDRTVILVVALIAALGLLWLFPIVLFAHQGPNDAILLSDLEPPILLVGLGSLLIVAVRVGPERGTTARASLGVFSWEWRWTSSSDLRCSAT